MRPERTCIDWRTQNRVIAATASPSNSWWVSGNSSRRECRVDRDWGTNWANAKKLDFNM